MSNVITRKRIGVLYGGRSVEHEISVLTALEAAEALDPVAYEVELVYVDLTGRWWTGGALKDPGFYPKFHENGAHAVDNLVEVHFLASPGMGLVRLAPASWAARVVATDAVVMSRVHIDVFMPLFHGTYGEDGCIQGMLEVADVAYTGCGVLASALGMNKMACKRLARVAGVPVLDAHVLSKSGWTSADVATVREAVRWALGDLPYFIKPVNLGSSVGIGKAETEVEFLSQLLEALKYDGEVMIERLVPNLFELNVAVRTVGGKPEASRVEMPATGVLTYSMKYLAGSGNGKTKGGGTGMATMARRIDPEEVAQDLKQRARDVAKQVYSALGCQGVVRVDFLVDGVTQELWFNEINTLPGSLANYLFSKSTPPLNYTDLLTAMLMEAETRHSANRSITRTFGWKALQKGG